MLLRENISSDGLCVQGLGEEIPVPGWEETTPLLSKRHRAALGSESS